jgi:hypothetical protein
MVYAAISLGLRSDCDWSTTPYDGARRRVPSHYPAIGLDRKA